MNHFVKGNPDLCIGCRTCMIGCVVAHEGLHIFEVDPDSYNFNPKLNVIKTAAITVPVQCKHCENPACMAVCPEKCIHLEKDAVVVETDRCIGCKTCVMACPYGAIEIVQDGRNRVQIDGSPRMIANKCDLCIHSRRGPECVRVCPTEALTLVTEEDLEKEAADKRIAAAKALAEVNGA